jgi:hypothetical protein
MSRLKPGLTQKQNDREENGGCSRCRLVRHQLFLHGYADTYYLAGFGLLHGDPLGGAGVEHVEREAAAAEDFVVERADVEPGA